MAEPPQVKLENSTLVFSTKNSSRNSTLIIYKVEAKANNDKKVLVVTAKQVALKKALNSFEIRLDGLGIKDINGLTINWIDPDGNKTAIKL